jgi:hypothetical protein
LDSAVQAPAQAADDSAARAADLAPTSRAIRENIAQQTMNDHGLQF